MNKLFSKIATLSVGLAMAIGVGVAVGSKGVKVARAAASVSGGTAVTINSKSGFKFGTSKAAGTASISIDSGSTKLSFKAIGWKGENVTVTPSCSGMTFDPSNYSIESNDAITGTGTTFTNIPETEYSFTFDAVDSQKTISLAATSGKRFILWDVSCESGAPVEKHDVIFNANGTGVTGMPENLTDKSGTVSLAGVASPSREGYKFKGWSLTSSGAVVDSVTVSDADVNVYAIWEEFVPTNYAETELKEGNLLITTSWDGDTYYLPTTTSSSAAPSAIKFTDVSEIDPENLWTVTSDSGSWIFQNANNDYLAITGDDNNRVRVGGTAGSWAVQEDGSLKGANNRYLGVYSGQDWRSYNSSTHANYKESAISLKFYEVSSDPSKKNMTIYTSGNPASGAQIGYSKNAGTHVFSAQEGEDPVSGVTWSVSDETVATINASTGAMTTLKPGNVTVFAEAEGYNKASAAVEIIKGWLEELTLTGSMSKTSYYVGESWSHEGFVLTATYHYGWEEEVSSTASWTYNPAAPALGVTSVVATATLEEESAVSSAQAVTVSKTNPLQVLYTLDAGTDVNVYGVFVGNKDNNNIIIMDGEYGMDVYKYECGTNSYVPYETILHVVGKTANYNGLIEISNTTTIEEVESADVATPVIYAAKGGETAEYASRSTTVSGIPTVTKGDFNSAAGTADITMNFAVASSTVQVFYKKATQTGDAEAFEAMKAAVENQTEITIKGFTAWYNGFQVQMTGYIPPAEDYTAEDFAQDLLNQTDAVCEGWKKGDDNHDAIEAIWSDLASNDKYPSLPNAQKTILAEAERDEEGTIIEQAMARYDYLTGKYNLSNFINGRTPVSFASNAYANLSLEGNPTIFIVVAVATASTLAFTLLLVFKKKKHN